MNNSIRHRSGITMLVVVGVLAVTIALSYAIMRTQVISSQIQENLNRRADAKQAAMTGLSVGLRKMRLADWSGVDTQFIGYVDPEVYYVVSYAVGDALLTSSDPDYDMYPYRVTVTSTGYTADAATSQVTSTHQVQAVVELVPRALSSQPANWASLQNHTVHQWKDADVICQTPVRIEGPVALQGSVKLCEDYPPSSRPWHGQIDEVALFNRALTQVEIQSIVTAAGLGNGTMPTVYTALLPTHWWRLDESSGTTAVDSTGGATGILENATTPGVTGAPIGSGNLAAGFDGRNDHINVGNLDVPGTALTLLGWFKADSWDGSTDARIISKASGTEESQHTWMLSTTKSGSNIVLRFRIRTNGSTKTLIASSGSLHADQWYCAAAVYDGTHMALYLDGVEVGRATKSGEVDTDPDAPVYIGDNPPGSPQTRLLRDLEAMRAAGLDDWRPFGGPLDLPMSNTDDSTLAMLQDDLNLTINDVVEDNGEPVSHPGIVSTYQLYPGGQVYSVISIGSGDRWVDLVADPVTNPLGLFHVVGGVNLQEGVIVEGTVIARWTRPDVNIEGDNVSISPVALPMLYGTNTGLELPVVIAYGDMEIYESTGAAINGLVFVGDEFTFKAGSYSASCAFSGRLLAGRVRLHGRSEWEGMSGSEWEASLTAFLNQLAEESPGLYYPNWLSDQHSLSSEPLLTIKPRSDAVTYHWPADWSQPIFVAHPEDSGLLWKIIRIDDD